MSSRFVEPNAQPRSPRILEDISKRPPPSPTAPLPKKQDAKSRSASLEPGSPTPRSSITEQPIEPSASSTVESSDTDVIDMETFQQILELDDDDLEFSRDMAYAYFTQAETTFDQMEKAFKGDDLHELGSLGHFLKGSSAALGVSKVQATCEKIQHYGQMKDDETEKPLTKPEALAKIEPLLSSVKIEYTAAKRWLETYYATRTPGETT